MESPKFSITSGQYYKKYVVLFECLFSRPTIKPLQFIQGQTCYGCISHDIGSSRPLLRELMKLSYYIHRAYCKKLSNVAEIEPVFFIVCLTSNYQYFAGYLRLDRLFGALIMTYSK